MKSQIDKAIEVLKRGGLILYPTDTVWGIGCDAANGEAVEKIYKLKRSSDKKGMLVLTDSIEKVSKFVKRVPEVAWQLLEVTDKPLTLILPGGSVVAANLIPEDGTIGIRIPQHEFCHELLRRFGRAVVSTSANIAGEPTPIRFNDISNEITEGVDLVIDPEFEAGSTGQPSSIIKLGLGGEIKIIR